MRRNYYYYGESEWLQKRKRHYGKYIYLKPFDSERKD